MTLKSQEHHDLMGQFDRESTGLRLDKEPKDGWTRGRIYQDGQVNELFLAYRRGYALAKSIYQVGSVPVSEGEASIDNAQERSAKEQPFELADQARQEIETLKAELTQVQAELLMLDSCLHNSGTDPMAWCDGIRERVDKLLSRLVEQEQGQEQKDQSRSDHPRVIRGADQRGDPQAEVRQCEQTLGVAGERVRCVLDDGHSGGHASGTRVWTTPPLESAETEPRPNDGRYRENLEVALTTLVVVASREGGPSVPLMQAIRVAKHVLTHGYPPPPLPLPPKERV